MLCMYPHTSGSLARHVNYEQVKTNVHLAQDESICHIRHMQFIQTKDLSFASDVFSNYVYWVTLQMCIPTACLGLCTTYLQSSRLYVDWHYTMTPLQQQNGVPVHRQPKLALSFYARH